MHFSLLLTRRLRLRPFSAAAAAAAVRPLRPLPLSPLDSAASQQEPQASPSPSHKLEGFRSAAAAAAACCSRGPRSPLAAPSRTSRSYFSVDVSPGNDGAGDGRHDSACFPSRNSLRFTRIKNIPFDDEHSHTAVTTALWCNFFVFCLKFGVWVATSSHVMLAELVHSVADLANQALLAYGLNSSKRAPDALHPYGYSKERFVWSFFSAVGIFCLGSFATVVHGFQNLWNSSPPENIHYAALVIGGSFLIEGASLLVAIKSVKTGAAIEGMSVWNYIWKGHDPTSVAVMTEDGAAVTGLLIAAASLVAVQMTGNPIYDPIGSITVGTLLGLVAMFLIQRNRHALLGRAIDDDDMERVLQFLKSDPVVDGLYDCKSEVIGPGFYRFKAEIDFNGEVLVKNYLDRHQHGEWIKRFQEAAKSGDDKALLQVMGLYGKVVAHSMGYEVDRLEAEIQKLVPAIRHVDIEANNPEDKSLYSSKIMSN